MSLKEILEHRRAVRKYDPDRNPDPEKVKQCINLAMLAPTSSNMQLWEAYHITNPDTLKQMAVACLGQGSARSCKQMVVFVTRQDKWKSHAKAVLDANIQDIKQNSPADRQAHRIKLQQQYYGKLMPFTYRRCLRGNVHKSCALVVETFLLAMSEQGFDTCPLEGFDSKMIKKILHLPACCDIDMVITCGYRTEGGVRGERFRLPLQEFYHRV